jgi:P22 coat protein - gene protein 5
VATNALLTPALITKETLTILTNNLVAAAKVNRQFENQFVKIGTTLTVRKPNRFTVTLGPALQIQDITEPSTSISISTQAHIDFQFSSQELTLTIEEYSERYCKPAAETLANTVDVSLLQLFNQINNEVGTPGSPPASFASLAAVGQRMDENAAPQDGRVLILNAAAYWALANGVSNLFTRSVAEPALKGFLAVIANFEIYLDQNVQAQTVGAYAGTGVVNGAGQSGSQIVTNGWTASITGLLNVGDVITFSGVHNVNPQPSATGFISTGALQNFVITAITNSDSGGNATLNISPAITLTGPYQNVDVAPANGATVTVTGTASTAYFQNLAFTRDAFGLVCVPMELPGGVDFAARQMFRAISMRIVRAYDVWNDVTPCRIDILYGVSTFYQQLACRLTN